MAIQINGNGTITGISAGGLPAGSVTSATLAAAARGKILQVVQATKTSEFSNTSTSYTDLTGLSASITPQTNSKILSIVEIQTYVEMDNNEGYGMQLVRTPSGGSGTNIYTSANKFEVYGYTDLTSDNIQKAMRSHWHILDSSVGGNGSTAITYKVQVANYTSSQIRYSQDGNISTLTLMEIAA